MQAPGTDEAWVDPTWTRLEDQIDWHERRATQARRAYRGLRVIEVVLGALIPFLAGFQDNLAAVLPAALHLLPAVLIALLGVGIVVLEGLQHLNQYHQCWLSHRSTCAALEHEKFLFLADAGAYGASEDKRTHLAERVEDLISSEHAEWVSTRSRRSGRNPSY